MREVTPIFEAEIPSVRLGDLKDRLSKVNDRAVRMKQPVLVLTEHGPCEVVVQRVRMVYDAARGWVQHVSDIKVPGTRVSIEGSVPKIPGWDIAGHLNIKKAYIQAETGRAKAMPVTAFGEFSEEELRTALISRLDTKGRVPCDHCATVRNRKEAFLLVSDSDRTRMQVVGSECATDFCGHEPAAILRAFQGLSKAREIIDWDVRLYGVLEEYDWESFRAAKQAQTLDLVRLLAHAADEARRDGFIGQETGDRMTTAQAATKLVIDGADPSPEGYGVADEVLNWLPNMGFRNDDLWRARKLGRDVSFDDAALAVRCVIEWSISTINPLRGDFIGTPGDRVDLTMNVTGTGYTSR